MESTTANKVFNVAGLIAKTDSVQTATIVSANVNVNIGVRSASYVSAIVSDAKNAVVSKSEAKGTITYSNINNAVCIGGIVAQAYNTRIEECGIGLAFAIAANNLTDKYIGALVGSIYGSSAVSKCYAYYKTVADTKFLGPTTIYGTNITIGVFGAKDQAISIPALEAKYTG